MTGTSTGNFTVAPTITSFTPTSAPIDTIVTITGTNFSATASSDTVQFNGTAATISSASTTQLVVTVPWGSTTGPICVQVSSGTAGCSSSNFTLQPPTITSFTPTSGLTGTSVTITGTNFSTTPNYTLVSFNGKNATINSVTSTQLVATVPTGATTGPIYVYVAALTAMSSSNFTVPAPTITSFTPTSGPVGTVVTITGTNFSTTLANDSVYFYYGGTAVVTSATSTQLVVTVPNLTETGLINVTVNGQSAASSSNFTVTSGAITGFTPTSGPPGTVVTITGDFSPTVANDYLYFNGYVGASITSATSTQLVVTVPQGSTTGPLCISVSGGTAGCSISNFTVPVPTITSFTPTSGTPGTVVTITGTNFSSTPASNAVKFSGVAASVASATSTQLVVTVTEGSTTGPICVTVSYGTAACSSSNFTVLVPTITSFTPTSGPVGTVVTITGTNFSTTPANDSVFFHGAYAAVVSSATSTQLVATILKDFLRRWQQRK